MVKSHREFCSVNSDVVPCDLYDLFHFQQISNGTNSSDSENIEDAIDLTESVPVQEAKDTSGCLSFNQKALQRYILYCAQNVDGGGLRGEFTVCCKLIISNASSFLIHRMFFVDKPGKSRDFYHR